MKQTLLLTKQKVFFDIYERPIFVDKKEVPDKKAIINADTDKVIGIVGKRYVPATNIAIISHLDRILSESKIPWEFEKGHIIRGGSKTIIELAFPTIGAKVSQDDELQLRGYLINSFDGYSSAILKIGFLRLICTNGMMVGTSEIFITSRHMSNVTQNLVAEFKAYIKQKVKEATHLTKKLQNLKFQDKKRMLEIIQASTWIPQKYIEAMIAEYEKIKMLNAWSLYNVFTYVITHIMQVNMERKILLYKELNREMKKWHTSYLP
jgi:hypothetical protein